MEVLCILPVSPVTESKGMSLFRRKCESAHICDVFFSSEFNVLTPVKE
jgi:hypothetical protein